MNLAPMVLAIALAISGIAQAQYIPKNPLDTDMHEFSLEQRCTLWAEGHIGANHVPAECEIYVDPIPDTTEARNKVLDTQSSSFIRCMNEYIRAADEALIMVPWEPGHNAYMTTLGGLSDQSRNNMIDGQISQTLGRVRVCQADNAMTDEQVREKLAWMSNVWNTISSNAILNPTRFPPEQIKVLLNYWTKIMANII